MTFTADLKEFAQKTKEDISTVIQESAIDLFSEIIRETPVGNPSLWKNPPPANYVAGSLQSNWQCSLDSPKNGKLTTIISDSATIEAMKSVVIGAQPDQTIFLTNNLPYGERIEYLGWSHAQKPEGMVRVSVSKFKNQLANAVAKVAA